MALAKLLVAGADVWLNTPLPPLEASGTSGMKAALNGVPNLSVLDGWWVEACDRGRHRLGDRRDGDGARDGDHARRPLRQARGERSCRSTTATAPRWIWMMKQAISKIGGRFNSQRMMRRYASEAYLR